MIVFQDAGYVIIFLIKKASTSGGEGTNLIKALVSQETPIPLPGVGVSMSTISKIQYIMQIFKFFM